MDVAVISCKHMFHPFCLGAMLKQSNKCCICNVKLHPDWWTSWGFGELDEELIKFAKQMKLAKAQDDKMLKVKEAVTSGQYLSPKGMPFTLTDLIKQNGVHMFLDFHML
jgi:hypothetical protein